MSRQMLIERLRMLCAFGLWLGLMLAVFSASAAQAQSITVSPTSGLVTEETGTTTTFSVVLDTQPTDSVSIGLSINDATEISINTSTLVFLPGNFDIPQVVTLTGLDDGIGDGNVGYTIFTDPAVSTDGNYNGLDPDDVTGTNLDDESAVLTPQMRVSGNGVDIADGDGNASAADHTQFGFIISGNSTVTRTFTIHNDGTGVLTLGANAVLLSGSAASVARFNIDSQPAETVAPGGSTSFSITYSVPLGSGGGNEVNVQIANDDAAVTQPYDFEISGYAYLPPVFAKSYGTSPIPVGGLSRVRYAIDGSTTAPIDQNGAFVDTLPAGLEVAATPNVATSGECSAGTVTAAAGSRTISWTGGGVLATTCTIELDVTATAAGTYTSTTGDLTGTLQDAVGTFTVPGASATLEVIGTPQMRVSGNGKDIADGDGNPSAADHTDFGSIISGNSTVTRTFTIHNDGTGVLTLGPNAVSLNGNVAQFNIDSQPAETVAPGGSTSFSITYSAPANRGGGSYVTVKITNDDTTIAQQPYDFGIGGRATLPPAFAKSYGSSPIPVGGLSRVRYTIDHFDAMESSVRNGAFVDTLPAGLEVAATPNVTTSGDCSAGTVTAAAGSQTISWTGGGVVGPSTCTIEVDVTATAAGTYTSTTGDLTGGLQGAVGTFTVPGATATLVVNAFADISITKTDGLTSANAGDDVTYTIVAANAGPSDDPAVSVADNFPASLNACSYTSVGAGGATGNTASGSGDIADTVNMPSGSSVTYTATCTLDPSATGTLSNTATATASVTDPTPGNNSATDGDTEITSTGTIVIVQDTLPNDAQDFAFTTGGGVPLASFNLDDDSDATLANNISFNNLPVGSFSVSQTAVAGFDTVVSCVDPDSGSSSTSTTANIDLDPTETVTCTFTSTENVPPTVAISGVPATANGPFTATFTFSENVSGFELADIDVGNGAASDFSAVSATVYTALITPASDGDVTIDVAASVAQDGAGNDNEAAAQAVALFDGTPPTVEILGAPETIPGQQPFDVTVQFSEAVTGFVVTELAVGNGSASGFAAVDQDTYTATITPTGGGDVTIDVYAGVAADLAGNPNLAAVQVVVGSTVVEDTARLIGQFMQTRARLIVASQPDVTRRLDRLNGRDTNNGGISGFGLSVRSGAIPFVARLGEQESTFSYSLQKSRAAGSETQFDADLVTLLGLAGVHMTSEETDNRRIAAKEYRPQAGVTARTGDRPHAGEATYAASYAPTGDADARASQRGARSGLTGRLASEIDEAALAKRMDVWVEGKYSRFQSAGGDGSFTIVHAGLDYLVTPDILIGFGGQFDWTDYDAAASLNGASTAGSAHGFGFMFGPYVTARLSDALYADARIAYGHSYNSVSPYNTYADDFDTRRWLASAALIGDYDYGAFNIRPELRLSWFRETSGAYVDTLSNLIPSIEVETGTLEFGPEISTSFEVGEAGTLTPSLLLQGVWTFAQDNSANQFATATANNTQLPADEGLRGRVSTSLSFANDNGATASLTASFDGIGDDNFDSWGLRANIGYRW